MASISRRLLAQSSSSLLEISKSIRTKFSSFIVGPNQEDSWQNFPVMKVDNFSTLLHENKKVVSPNPFAGSHWLVYLSRFGFEFGSEKELLDHYIQTLATALGSEEEARKRIYLVSVARPYGFCAQFDLETKNKLQGLQIKGKIFPDFCYKKTRNSVQSDAKFTTRNWNHRIDNIFMYHYLSKQRNSKCNNSYWLINTREPDSGFSDNSKILSQYINLLADVLGSEEQAKESIYVVWFKFPFGFGAKIDLETSKKLKGRLDVLNVLPDYAFDVNGDGVDDDEALIIDPPSHGTSFNSYCPSKDKDNSKHLTRTQKQIGASGFLTYSGLKDVSRDWVTGMEKHNFSTYSELENDLSGSYLHGCNWNVDCKHWFVSVEKPVNESASMQQMIDTYIKTLAMVIGSEKAKGNIYRIKYENQVGGFAAKMDVHTSNKLKGIPGVVDVVPDHLFGNSYQDDFSVINGTKEMKVNLKSWQLAQ